MVPTYPVAVLPYASLAVTVTVPGVPAVTGEACPETVRVLAVPGFTIIPAWLPVMEGVIVSVAVTDWVAAVFRTTPLNV